MHFWSLVLDVFSDDPSKNLHKFASIWGIMIFLEQQKWKKCLTFWKEWKIEWLVASTSSVENLALLKLQKLLHHAYKCCKHNFWTYMSSVLKKIAWSKNKNVNDSINCSQNVENKRSCIDITRNCLGRQGAPKAELPEAINQ